MNYMEQVAQMLGVNLEEEFELKKSTDGLYRFKLSRIGLVCSSPITLSWHEANKLLVDLLLGKDEIIKISEPILDEKEREYLSYVIRPFRDRVKYIYKFTCANGDYEAIAAVMEACGGYCDYLDFPKFRKGTMYKGMETVKEYSPEDLGL